MIDSFDYVASPFSIRAAAMPVFKHKSPEVRITVSPKDPFNTASSDVLKCPLKGGQ